MELKEVGDQVFAAECILKSRVRKVGCRAHSRSIGVHGVLAMLFTGDEHV